MNNIYKTVWSNAKQCFVVTSELAKSAGKKSSLVLKSITFLTLPLLSLLSTLLVNAAPQNGVVTQGSASISSQGSTTTINQSSSKAIINWSSFNIDRSETVNFKQPSVSAVALNRINDSNGSQIMGSLNANGNVFLINPNGITFAKGAQVNVAGLVASTLTISDEKFLKGNYQFSATGNNDGKITNFGKINANTIALLGNQVINNGWIVATAGDTPADIALVAADNVTIKFGQYQRLGIKINKGTLNALVNNQQLIQADGGKILLRAAAANTLLGAAVNNSGTIRAQTLQEINGEILLLADMQNGTTNVSGILDASAPTKGNGGFIETSAATVNIQNNSVITTLAALGDNGNWLIDPADYTIAATGGDITGADLSTNLNLTNVIIQTSTFTDVGEPGDIYVNDDISWSASTSLTLIAENNIYINSEIKATGDGAGVIFDTALDDEASTAEFIESQHLQLGENGKVTLLGEDAIYQLDDQDYLVINGNNTSIDGDSALEELQNINENLELELNYVLGDDIDASDTLNWNDGDGFVPLGDFDTPFSGMFSGSGHEIDQLVIDLPDDSLVGLFGITVDTLIRDVGLTNINITGESAVGGIVGAQIDSAIYQSYVTGIVSGEFLVGGIAGGQMFSSINNSYSTANTSGDYVVGGIVGGQLFSSINSSHTTGSTSGYGDVDEIEDINGIGGIAGVQFNSTIDDSYSIGDTSGVDIVGGIVGLSSDLFLDFDECECFEDEVEFEISDEFSSQSIVTNSYSTGDTSGEDYIGGIAGIQENGIINNSYTTGDVNGADFVGGIAGLSYSSSSEPSPFEYVIADEPQEQEQSSVIDTYSKGDVNGESNVGGLIGSAINSRVATSYSSGAVTGDTNTGGFIGSNENSAIEDSFFTESTAQAQGIGEEISDSPSVDLTLLSTAESMQLSSYIGFDISDEFNAGTVWRIYEGHITPVLSYFLTPVSDFNAQLSTIYFGNQVNAVANSVSYADTVDSTQIFGTVTLQTNSADAASYKGSDLTIESDLYSTIYDINNGSGGDATSSVTITPKTITVSDVTAQDKVFDGNTSAVLTGASLSGVIDNEEVNLQTDGTFLTPDVGNNKDVLADYSINNSNYQLTTKSEVLKASITSTNTTPTTPTTPIVTITPVSPNIPEQNNTISATPEFDANPFGETAAGGGPELGGQGVVDCVMLLDNIGSESTEEMTENSFNCAISAGQSNDNS